MRKLTPGVATALLLSAVVAAEAAHALEGPRLSGVLVSESRRIAVVDGEFLGVGDRHDGVIVAAIDADGVRVRAGRREHRVRVGGHWPQGLAATAPIHTPDPLPDLAAERVYIVTSGDTLSEIAERFRPAGMSLNEAVSRIFASNRHAFGKNIDILMTGAQLNLADFESAAPVDAGPVMRARRVEVETGDTLSGIAARAAPAGASLEQTMAAIFDANPEAFGGNMNLLLAGAVLTIPGTDDIVATPKPTAEARVRGQHVEWQHRKLFAGLGGSPD